MEQPPVPVTLVEYMLGEWFETAEVEEEEEALYSRRMITMDIGFQEHSVMITQDNRTKSNHIYL